MELKQADRLLLKTLYLAAAGIVVTQALGMKDWTSWLFVLTFPLTVLLWLRSVRATLTASDLIMLVTIVIAGVSVLLGVSFSGGGLSLSYLRKLIMFAMTLLFLQTAHRARANVEMTGFINNLIDLLTLFLIAMFFLNRSQMYLLNGYVTQYLTFRFDNPNTTGLFLTCMYMLEAYRLFTREKWYLKIVHIVMAVFLAWFVLLTQSRNCLLVLILFTAACAWLVFRSKRRLCINKFWATLISWFPLIFVGLYMFLIYTPWIQEVFSFLVDIGKNLDSRVEIWTTALEAIAGSPVIGDYYGISNGTGTAQLHNTHLDIAASYGIPVLVLVTVLLSRYLHQRGRFYQDKEHYSYMLGFACTLVLGMGEAALFSGGLGIYIFVGTFLLLAGSATVEGTAV